MIQATPNSCLLKKTSRNIIEEASWRRHQGGGIREKASGRRHHGGGIMEEASWKRHHGGGIMEEASWKRHQVSPVGGIWEESGGIWGIWEAHINDAGGGRDVSGRDLVASRGIWGASGRHLGDIWEASGGIWKHLGGIWMHLETSRGIWVMWEVIAHKS